VGREAVYEEALQTDRDLGYSGRHQLLDSLVNLAPTQQHSSRVRGLSATSAYVTPSVKLPIR